MVRIHCYNMSQEELGLAEAWAQKNKVELTHTEQSLSLETLSLSDGADGLSLAQITPIDPLLYQELARRGFRQIAQRSAGVDMYDLEEAKRQNILITNVPSYSPESIAEYTVLRILQLLRQERQIQGHVMNHNFTWNSGIRGAVLGEQTVALIGVGRIGSRVARFLKGFGCRVLAYDSYINEELREYVEYISSLEELVSQADIVSVHLPLTRETVGLFNARIFASCKTGALFLNMARGGLVVTKDLLTALDTGQISAAALDTYENEGDFVRHDLSKKEIKDPIFRKLLNHPRILYSPHVAYYTDTAVREIVEQALDAALAIIRTGVSHNCVNK